MELEYFRITEGELARYGLCHHNIGVMEGLSMAVKLINRLSGSYYAEHKDQKARETRDVSKVILNEIARLHEKGEQAKKGQLEVWTSVLSEARLAP